MNSNSYSAIKLIASLLLAIVVAAKDLHARGGNSGSRDRSTKVVRGLSGGMAGGGSCGVLQQNETLWTKEFLQQFNGGQRVNESFTQGEIIVPGKVMQKLGFAFLSREFAETELASLRSYQAALSIVRNWAENGDAIEQEFSRRVLGYMANLKVLAFNDVRSGIAFGCESEGDVSIAWYPSEFEGYPELYPVLSVTAFNKLPFEQQTVVWIKEGLRAIVSIEGDSFLEGFNFEENLSELAISFFNSTPIDGALALNSVLIDPQNFGNISRTQELLLDVRTKASRIDLVSSDYWFNHRIIDWGDISILKQLREYLSELSFTASMRPHSLRGSDTEDDKMFFDAINLMIATINDRIIDLAFSSPEVIAFNEKLRDVSAIYTCANGEGGCNTVRMTLFEDLMRHVLNEPETIRFEKDRNDR